MPTLNQVRTAIDDWLAARWPAVQSRQATYASNHGGAYWQGLVSCVPAPAHTTNADGSVVPNRFDVKPADMTATWADVMPEWVGQLAPAAIWMDAYDGPLGTGYVASVRATFNGVTWQRSQNVGPETWRTQPWQQVST
jgi:hypothetical protein